MSNLEIIASQAPMLQEYVEWGRVQWSASRHPENLAEITSTAKIERPELSKHDKALLAGTTIITLVQQLPLNEMAVGLAVGTALELSNGNLPLAVASAGVVTGAAEAASGIGMAHSIERFPNATQIISERYVNHQKIAENDVKREARGKKPASETGRIYGVASIALTSGATLYEALRDRTRTLQDNLRTAKIATGMVAFNYMFVTGVVVGSAEGAEALGADGVTERLQNTIRNPIFMATILGGLVGIFKAKKYLSARKGLKARIEGGGELSQKDPILIGEEL